MADDPLDNRTQYDESVDISTERDRAIPKEDQPCKHGNDPNVCEELECLIEWHHEND